MKYILSIDQSTSGTKGMIFDAKGGLVARCDLPHRQITNEKGWVEHDLNEILENTLAVAKMAVEKAGVALSDIAAVGISNQRETAACWDKLTGKPLYNAIVWQCGRATDIEAEIKEKGMEETVYNVTGLTLSPFFSAAKFGWMIKHVPEVKKALEEDRLCCGTIDAWLVYSLTGNFKTDYSNASRTQLLDLDTLRWSKEVTEAFGLTLNCLPEICMSDSDFGLTDFGGLFPEKIPVHGVMGDSHGALFANGCLNPGMAKVTYGTGSSIMMNVGKTRPKGHPGIVTSLAWGRDGEVDYVLEGNINYTGAVTKWLVDDVELMSSSKEAGPIAETVSDTGGVYFIPAFTGLGAPYFITDVKAALVGISYGTKKAHIVRASEECIAYQIADVVSAVNAASAEPLGRIHVDGGPTKDSFLMQFQADILGIPVMISSMEELSGAGAAYCAAVGAGISTMEEIFSNTSHREVLPEMTAEDREKFYSGWQKAVADFIR